MKHLHSFNTTNLRRRNNISLLSRSFVSKTFYTQSSSTFKLCNKSLLSSSSSSSSSLQTQSFAWQCLRNTCNTKITPRYVPLLNYNNYFTTSKKENEEKINDDDNDSENIRKTSEGTFIATGIHKTPSSIGDRVALGMVKALRIPADFFFKKKYIHRAVVLETVAAVPGMVAGMVRHMRSLRRMQHDGGWIHELLDEAENERMHLLTFIKISQPTWFERFVVVATQGVFFNVYFFFYMFFPRVAHRFVGYLEEEAVISYTQFLQEIDEGRIENVPAPQIAINYWKMKPEARLRDVVVQVRLDEAVHRDVNHKLSDRLIPVDLHAHSSTDLSATPTTNH